MEVTTPPGWKSHQTTVVMVHGLSGSHRSSYVVRLAKKLYQKGVRSIRVNLRGCGSGKGYAWRLYHAESSDDIWQALKEIKRDTPHSPLILVGFSLGGNIVLKMGGEREREALTVVDKIIAINPPIDMYSSVLLLSQNKLYERFFMHVLRSGVEYCHDVFEDLPSIKIPHSMTLMEFNEHYIALHSEFSNARDYYYACSAGRLIPSIRVPSHILFSKDDPIVDSSILSSIKYPDNIKVVITERGGHLGYLGSPMQEGGVFWLDFVLFQWIFDNWSGSSFA